MPSRKPKKQLERFRLGMDKFVEMFTAITGMERTDVKETSRNGITTVTMFFTPGRDGMPPTRAAKLGEKMAHQFHVFFSPTHYEMYRSMVAEYIRGEGIVRIRGTI